MIGMVPLMTPVDGWSVRPAGRDPLVNVNVSGKVPPVVEIPVVTGPTANPGMAVDSIWTTPVGLGLTVL